MNRRKSITGSPALVGVATTSGDSLASDKKQPTTSAAQSQQASFGQARRDFPQVGGNLANHNYSTLKIINRENVRRLGGAWRINLEGGDTKQNQQGTIVAVDGILFVQATQQNVLTVDGKTGAANKNIELDALGDPQRRRAVEAKGTCQMRRLENLCASN